jgi:SAM-dependent methyltransferase
LSLYENSVQCPEEDVVFFSEIYQSLRGGRVPKVLREDFCGTARLSLAWCLSDPSRRAFGIDLDGPTLDWAHKHNFAPNASVLGRRLKLVQANVLDSRREKADITCACNFSFCILKERPVLRRYLELVRDGLKRNGLLFLEIYGGTEAIQAMVEERKFDDFKYVWDQHSFNPVTHETLCHIHYRFPDGSRLERAFTYDWRLWTIPELRDLLVEVGFSEVRVFWEKVDQSEDEDDKMLRGTGAYEDVTNVAIDQQESFLAYVIGLR